MTRKLNSDDDSAKSIKFLYSYGGKIVPRPTDGKLRYAGGMTRVLSVDRSITYTELAVKFVESCGSSLKLACKLPTEDLDVLVSITCDEDLANVIEVYDRTNKELKIRAILSPSKSVKDISTPPSPVNFSAAKPPQFPGQKQLQHRFINNPASKPVQYPVAGFYSPSAAAAYRCSAGQQFRHGQSIYGPRLFNYKL